MSDATDIGAAEARHELLQRLDEIERHAESDAIKPDVAIGMMIKELARHVVHASTLADRVDAAEREARFSRWLLGMLFAAEVATAIAVVFSK